MASPLMRTVDEQVPAVATAVTDTTNVARAPFTGSVFAVRYTPDAAITGVNTNTRRYDLVNKGQAGAGAVVVATLQMNAGTNGVASDELSIPVTPANAAVTEGDILAWVSTAVGTGLADPGGYLTIDFARS